MAGTRRSSRVSLVVDTSRTRNTRPDRSSTRPRTCPCHRCGRLSVSRAHCPQCGCDFESGGALPSEPFHRAIWSLGVLSLGALGIVLLAAVLQWMQPNLLGRTPGFSTKRKAEADILAIGSALDEYAIANGGRLPKDL